MGETLPQVTGACKTPGPCGNVTPRNVRRMKHNDWQRLDGSWSRLKWAREHWQRTNDQPLNAAAAAKSLQMEEGTYRAYERPPEASKHTPLNYEMAQKFARKFHVNWPWLLHKRGSPFDLEQPSAPMVIMIKAEFDSESQSWWAEADVDERNTLTTGATTLEELLDRIPIVLRDLLIDDYPDTNISFSVVAVAHKTGVVNTRAA
jgi:hypothetical protein